ncbi:hypothetical protein QAD02_000193 [Eretmocerus hayati]|uniref:Uncharacterized protein n=1 Tax=Eretmocerus hayati TaxID=131215 RepID=A0ACC2NCN5_9HYME|nr:hypothetical protein QAD02_000193 [Eretmocerus hayati]
MASNWMKVLTGTLILQILNKANAVSIYKAQNDMNLKLVNVVFRHGDRAPDPAEMFPSDPHYNDSFYPQGLGGLTNVGKWREYQLGHMLREFYDKFLGDLVFPETVYARSTDYKRTKASLQLVLAGLYPPKGLQRWNNEIDWQPIPTIYETDENDWLMIPEECPEYLRELERVRSLPEVVAKLESFREFLNSLTELTQKNATSPVDMYNLYHILTAEAMMNLTLPEWTRDIFPEGKLLDGINFWYEIFSYTPLMRRLNGGKLLRSIIDSMQQVTDSTIAKDRKIYLYSGHETNVAAVLQVLGLYKPHVPDYGSSVLFELFESRGKYYVRVSYYRGVTATWETQKIQGCAEFCLLEDFIRLLKDVTPLDDELVCVKSKKSST